MSNQCLKGAVLAMGPRDRLSLQVSASKWGVQKLRPELGGHPVSEQPEDLVGPLLSHSVTASAESHMQQSERVSLGCFCKGRASAFAQRQGATETFEF